MKNVSGSMKYYAIPMQQLTIDEYHFQFTPFFFFPQAQLIFSIIFVIYQLDLLIILVLSSFMSFISNQLS